MACFTYAQQNRGQFPPSAAIATGLNTIECFTKWFNGGADDQNNSSVRIAFARCLGVNVPAYPAPSGTTYSPPAAAILYCPTEMQLGVRGAGVESISQDPTNFLAFTGSGTNDGKFDYWYLANPYDPTQPHANQDQLAGVKYSHMNIIDPATGKPGKFDATLPGTPGWDYMRKVGDKRATEVQVCVDQSRQQQAAGGGWFWMHGDGSTNANRGWKNELFGDGHVDSRHPGDMWGRWAPSQSCRMVNRPDVCV